MTQVASVLRILLLLSVAFGFFAPTAIAGDGECCLWHRLESARWSQAASRSIPGFDPETGRSLLNYPPHPHVTYHHMRLDIDIPDMSVPRFDAVQTLTISPVARPLESLTLNAMLLDIRAVSVRAGQAGAASTAAFTHDGEHLRISFDPPLAPGVRTELITRYAVNDPPFGLIWTLPSPHWPGRAPQIHTQGQPEDNRYWFPMHDFPNVRLTTELVVSVPAGFEVLSNGRMVSGPARTQSERAPLRGRATFHWLQDKPHVTYLVSLIVGKFDIVDVAPVPIGRAGSSRPIPMPVYVPPGRAADVAGTYGRTPQMMEHFARLIDEPYPWDQYAHAVVWNFAPGGMENTSATTMHDTAILSPRALADADIEGLISHELAHQWFGDLITCNSWEHIWLNEGFATYFTNLWFEHRHGVASGPQAGRDAYFHGVIGNFDSVIAADRADAPFQPAMASKVYNEPWDVFRRAANPYPKGAAILHMLRQRLGDELFFRGIALYVDRRKGQNAETSDLRIALEDTSGENLEQFFRQWVFRPGVPHLDIGIDWDRSTSELVISVTQTQNIDGYNPAFEFTLPVWIQQTARQGQGTTVRLDIHGRETSARFPLAAEPAMVVIDPEMTVLARTSIRQPVRRWIAQLEHGPNLFSRVRAARALANRQSGQAGSALFREAQDTRNHARLRSEAIRALGRGGHMQEVLELASRPIEPPDVRLTMVETIGDLTRDESTDLTDSTRLIATLLRHASANESSDRTRAAAVAALGRLRNADHLNVVIAAANSDSQHDRVRQAGLEALGEIGHADGLAVAIRYSLPGTFNRTRPVAMNAVVKLAAHDPDTAYRSLAASLNDRERRAWEGAASALASLGDPRGLPALEALRDSKRDPRDRARVQHWLNILRDSQPALPEPAGNVR